MALNVPSELSGLRSLARSLVHGEAEAEDLLQDTAVTMLEHPPELDRPVRPWLVTVMLNRWRMDRRSETRRRARELAVHQNTREVPEATDPLERAQTLRRLSEAVEQLPEVYRDVVIARYFDGKSSIDIAERLGIPPVTVRTRLLRALERLRKSLDETAPRKKWQRALVPMQGGWLLKAKATATGVSVFFLLMLIAGAYYMWPSSRAPGSSPTAAGAPRASAAVPATGLASAPPPVAHRTATAGQERAKIEQLPLPGGGASGRVINWSTGEGVAGAELTFTSDAGAIRVESGEDGTFELAAGAPGEYVLAQVGATGYLPYSPEYLHSTVRFRLEKDHAVRGLGVFLFPALDYHGRVVDQNGVPVAGAKVSLVGTPEGEQTIDRVDAAWITDHDGKFTFHAADNAVLEAVAGERRGWARVDGNVAITKQLVVNVARVPARDATITGRVIDDAGKPLADVLVRAEPEGEWLSPHAAKPDAPPRATAFALTNGDGEFTIRGLDRLTYELSTEAPDRAPATKKGVAGGTRGVAITIASGARLAGTVATSDGAPVPAFTLLAYRRIGAARELVAARSLVDPRGHFELQLDPGTYELVASASGWAPSQPTAASAPSDDAKLTVSAGATLRGRVVSAADGSPIPHARVMREAPSGGASAQPANAGTVTRADGSFELRGIPAGNVSLTIAADQFDQRIESGLTASDGAELGPIETALSPLAPGAQPKIELVGIGVKLTTDGDDLLVQEVIPGGGAQAAGIVAGDHIASVDGSSVVEIGEPAAVTRIRGLPNTTVSLGLRRGPDVVTLVVTRSHIQA